MRERNREREREREKRATEGDTVSERDRDTEPETNKEIDGFPFNGQMGTVTTQTSRVKPLCTHYDKRLSVSSTGTVFLTPVPVRLTVAFSPCG